MQLRITRLILALLENKTSLHTPRRYKLDVVCPQNVSAILKGLRSVWPIFFVLPADRNHRSVKTR